MRPRPAPGPRDIDLCGATQQRDKCNVVHAKWPSNAASGFSIHGVWGAGGHFWGIFPKENKPEAAAANFRDPHAVGGDVVALQMNTFLQAVCGVSAGALGAMGLGGGSVLIVALRFFFGFSQEISQGINLLFYIPTALVAVFFHARNGFVNVRLAIVFAVLSILGAFAGSWLATFINGYWLSKIFAGLLIAMALAQFLPAKPRK